MGTRLHRTVFSIAAILVGSIPLSCSAPVYPNKFTHGHTAEKPAPQLTLAASASFTKKNKTHLNVNITLDAQSLMYGLANRSLVAHSGIKVKIINRDNHKVAISKNYDVKIKKALTADINNLGVKKINKKFRLPPGRYTIRVSATDKRTGREKTFATIATLKRPGSRNAFLTDIQLAGFNPIINQYEPINGYTLQSKYDSVRLKVQVSVPDDVKESVQMSSQLIRFASDTLPARSIGKANYSASNIQYKGVNYYQKDILQTINRNLPKGEQLTVEFKYPSLERGNYRFKVHLHKSSKSNERNVNRDFGIKSRHFPSIESGQEKARPLVYLMGHKTYNNLLSIHDGDSLENAIDQFWFHHIGNRRKAEAVKQQYFARVVIANREFSNYKEGWKTDRGMIYILFGNPWIIDSHLSTKTWFYTHNRLDERKKFVFHRTKVYNDSYPFHNYILLRKFDYNGILYQQRQLWLSGQILKTQI